MVKINIQRDDANQRLDRFLKKYFKKASLSQIYKMLRKDIKVNGKRAKEATFLNEGDELSIYISDEEFEALRESKKNFRAKRQFRIIYEDEDMIVVSKPFGLLTHGDSREKKNHLTNQVINYLISSGAYDPKSASTFIPSPANRLDRNTTGLVVFGKNADSLKRLNRMIRERESIKKYYLTIVAGELSKKLYLEDFLEKDSSKNMVKLLKDSDKKTTIAAKTIKEKTKQKESKIKEIKTSITPVKSANGFTLTEVELITGRPHQIRVHLAGEGFPIIGDTKYGDKKVNEFVKKKYGLTTQLLHAYKLVIDGKEIVDELPREFKRIKNDLIDN